MKAAILIKQKAPLEVADIEAPKSLDYGQVFVKVLVSGICGSQIGEIDGVKGPDRWLPHLLGHEACAVVQACGPGVTRVRPNDYVVLHWRPAPGIDAQTPTYNWNGKTVNAGKVTTFNEYAIVSENRMTPVPADTDPEVAALMGCAVTTGLGVICNNAQLKIGESIAIFGIGGVGLNIVQGASLVNANPIIAVDLYDHKLDLARKFGATHLINATKTDPKAEVLKIAGNAGVDVAVDNTGSTGVIETAYEVTSASGRTVLVGVPPKDKKVSIYTLPLHFEKKLLGSHGGESYPATDIPRYLNLHRQGKLSFDGMVSHRFALDEINTAIDLMRKGEVIRCLIDLV